MDQRTNRPINPRGFWHCDVDVRLLGPGIVMVAMPQF